MKLYCLLIFFTIGMVQNLFAKSFDLKLESLVKNEVVAETFPPMVIKPYTGREPNNGIYPLQGAEFIVQPEQHIAGFEQCSFEFYWYVKDSSGNTISDRHLSSCGIQVGTYIVNDPQPGTYTVGVDLQDADGNFVIVEKVMNFGAY